MNQRLRNLLDLTWRHRFMCIIAILSLGLVGTVASLLFYILFPPNSLQQMQKDVAAGDKAFQSAEWQRAEQLYRHAQDEAQAADNNRVLADITGKLAMVYKHEGNVAQQEATLRRALLIYNSINNNSIAGSVTWRQHMLMSAELANVLRDQHKQEEADLFYKCALLECNQQENADADKSRISLDYAKMLRSIGKIAEAEQLEAKVQASTDEAGAFDNGMTQFRQGSYIKADTFFRIALRDARVKHDGDAAARACIMLAMCNLSEKNYSDAKTLCKQALELADKSTTEGARVEAGVNVISAFMAQLAGSKKDADERLDIALKEHPTETGNMLVNLAAVTVSSKDKTQMDGTYALCEHALPRLPGSSAAELQESLGNLDRAMHRFANANERYKHAIDLLKYDPNSSHQASVTSLLADDLVVEHKYDEAEQLYRKALNLALNGRSNSSAAYAWFHIADCLYHKGKRDEAREAYKKALELNKAACGPSSVDVARNLIVLGNLEREEHRYKDALSQYLKVLPIYEELDSIPNADRAVLFDYMSECYFHLDMKQQAADYHKQAVSLRQKADQQGSD